MKRLVCVLLVVVALLGWVTTMVWAAPPDQKETAELVVEMSWDKDAVYVGDTVAVEVSIRNEGGVAVPDDAQVKFHLEVWAVDGAEKPKTTTKEEDLDDMAGLSRDDAPVKITQTFEAPAEGNYSLFAVLTGLDDILGETDGPSPFREPLAVQSALPPGIARLFAGLGMFAAVMAILAVGTEVAIDSVKPFLGMKQKVSAMEAFDQLKQELPGQLEDLGIDAKRLRQVDDLIKEVQVTLEPLQKAGQISGEIRGQLMAGDFGAAFKRIADLEDKVRDLRDEIEKKDKEVQGLKDEGDKAEAQEELKSLTEEAKETWENGKTAVNDGVANVLGELQRRLPLDDDMVDGIKTEIEDWMDNKGVEDVADLLGQVVTTVQKALGEGGPDLAKEWLTGQVDTFLVESRTGVLNLLDNKVIKTLKDLGFPQNAIDDVRPKLVQAVNSVEETMRGKTNTYADAMKALLIGVEERRNEMQSPWRKVYRRLRKSDNLAFWGTIPGVLVAIGGIVAAFIPGWWLNWLVGVLIAAAGLLVGALLGWAVGHRALTWHRNKYGKHSGFTLGEFLRKVEKYYNAARGRESTYGDVEETVKGKIRDAGPTTIAKVLLELEDFHRDEEASRIRVLRAISIIVGTYLALLFKIDALVLLDQALPGISQRNVTLTQDLTAGIVLTGLAASAGSKFWRDLLGRLQATKQQAESTAVMLRKAKATLVAEE